jgi:uncharacterized protein YrrD
MLHRINTLKDYKLDSLDGEMGGVADFYFDDQHWTVRYLVANTGNWLTGRQVLISPHALVAAVKDDDHVLVDLTRKQIEDSPSLASELPVSRQFEDKYYGYYGWPAYWGGTYAWGAYAYPGPLTPISREGVPSAGGGGQEGDPHLRCTNAVTGYDIQATDNEIGHVEDFVVDDQSWTIRYLIVDTRNWWPGKKVLISPDWIDRVSWEENKVFVSLPREVIKNAPEFSKDQLITREYEAELHRHYQREAYWGKEEAGMAHAR